MPQKSVLDSVVAFGYSPADVAELGAAGAAKAAEIAQFGKVVDVGHSCALYGCVNPLAPKSTRVPPSTRALEARRVRSLAARGREGLRSTPTAAPLLQHPYCSTPTVVPLL